MARYLWRVVVTAEKTSTPIVPVIYRHYLTRQGAEDRVLRLVDAGCVAHAERSNPITWPGGGER